MTRVVVVHEDERERRVLCVVLENEGYRVVETANAMHALRVVASQPVDLVVFDADTVLDGHSLLRALRLESPETLVISMTAARATEVEVLAAGAAANLRTPFTIEDLVETVVRVKPPQRDAARATRSVLQTERRSPILRVDIRPSVRKAASRLRS